MKNYCKDCKAYVERKLTPNGECRLHAPVATETGSWFPIVDPSCGCLEFLPRGKEDEHGTV